ncbi:MAG: hypothetical protein QXZ31_03875 [Thermofilaceae archaeon]
MTTLLLLLAFSAASHTLAEETPTTTTTECAVRRVQGEIEFCIPELKIVSTRNGYASVTWLNSTTAQFTLGFVNASGMIRLTVMDAYTNTVLCSVEVFAGTGESKSVTCDVGNSSVVVYSVDFNGEVVEAALVVPHGGLAKPGGVDSPLIVVLMALVPVSLFLSFVLTSDLREAAIMAGASMFALYAFASYIAPEFFAPWLTIAVGLLLLFVVIYYLTNR